MRGNVEENQRGAPTWQRNLCLTLVIKSTHNQSMSIGCISKLGHLSGFLRHNLLIIHECIIFSTWIGTRHRSLTMYLCTLASSRGFPVFNQCDFSLWCNAVTFTLNTINLFLQIDISQSCQLVECRCLFWHCNHKELKF